MRLSFVLIVSFIYGVVGSVDALEAPYSFNLSNGQEVSLSVTAVRALFKIIKIKDYERPEVNCASLGSDITSETVGILNEFYAYEAGFFRSTARCVPVELLKVVAVLHNRQVGDGYHRLPQFFKKCLYQLQSLDHESRKKALSECFDFLDKNSVLAKNFYEFLVDPSPGYEIRLLQYNPKKSFRHWSFAADQKFFIESGATAVEMWDMVTRKLLKVFNHDNRVLNFDIDPTGKSNDLITCQENLITIWDTQTGEKVCEKKCAPALMVAWSDNHIVVTARDTEKLDDEPPSFTRVQEKTEKLADTSRFIIHYSDPEKEFGGYRYMTEDLFERDTIYHSRQIAHRCYQRKKGELIEPKRNPVIKTHRHTGIIDEPLFLDNLTVFRKKCCCEQHPFKVDEFCDPYEDGTKPVFVEMERNKFLKVVLSEGNQDDLDAKIKKMPLKEILEVVTNVDVLKVT